MANLKSIKSQARIAEKIVTQESTDNDWGKVGETTLFLKPKEYPILTGSDPTTIISVPNLSNKKLNLVMGDNSVIETTFTDPVKTTDTVQTLDILGDGSCIATYPLDGNANDLSGNYNGTWYTKDSKGNTVKGGEAYDTGKFGQAAKFDGNTEIIINPELNENITISLWCFNTQADPNTRTGLFGTGDIEENSTIRLNFFDGNVYFQAGIGGTPSIQFDKTENWLNVWKHVVAMVNNGKLILFVDNTKVIEEETTNTYDHKNKIHIGYSEWYFTGLIDQVRIFNRALTDEEVQTLYKEQKAKYDISNLNLSLTPHKLFEAFETPKALVSLEATENDIVENLTEEILPVLKGSNNTNLITADLLPGEEIIVDGKDLEITEDKKLETTDTTQTLDVLGDGSCVAAYPFDGNANDLSGKYNGTWYTVDSKGNTVKGGEAYDTGKFGQAAKFDGSSWIEANDSKVGINTGDWTLSMWVNPNSFAPDTGSGGGSELFRYITDNGSDNGFGFDSEGNLYFAFYNDYRIDNRAGSYKFNLNEWQHLVITIDSSKHITGYINGKVVLEGDLTGTSNVTDNKFRIGKSEQDYFTGLIDQVRIFNKALTDEEIQKLYYEQKTKYDISELGLTDTPKSVIRKGYKELTITDSSTTAITAVSSKHFNITTSSKLLTDKGPIEVTNVNLEDTTQTLDILGDGSCIACYPLDGNANDLSGKYNGTWNGSEAYVDGVFGQAADLSNDTSTITTSLSFGDNAKSLSFWVYLIDVHGDSMLFAQDGSESPYNYIATNINNKFYISRGNTASFSSSSLDTGKWYHVVVQDTGSEIEVYFNGEKQVNEITDYNSISGLQISNFGYYPNSPDTNSAHCYMDQVRVFNKVLTEDEVQQLYKEESIKYNIEFNELPTPPSMIALPQKSQEQPTINTIFDGEKFVATYGDITKTGRAIQRKFIIPNKDIEIIPPITTKLYKKNS